MGYFKKLSAELTRKEINMLKTGNKDAFRNLSMDRQGEIYMILERLRPANA